MRSLLAGLLLLLGALMVPVATAGWWVRDTLVPTQAYLDTTAPLASDPAVTAAAERQIVDRTMAALAKQAPALSGPLRSRVQPLVRVAVHRAVTSPAFADAWRLSNRELHRQVVDILSGRSSAVRTAPGATVDISLRPVTQQLRRELTDAGIPFADQLSDTNASIPIGSATNLQRAQGIYQFLVRWGRWLPVAALVLIVAGLLVARRRAGALAWTALVSLVGLGALALAVYVGRAAYLHALPSGISAAAAKAVFGTVTSGLRHDILVVAVVAAVVLIVSVVARVVRR